MHWRSAQRPSSELEEFSNDDYSLHISYHLKYCVENVNITLELQSESLIMKVSRCE